MNLFKKQQTGDKKSWNGTYITHSYNDSGLWRSSDKLSTEAESTIGEREAPRGLRLEKRENDVAVHSRPETGLKKVKKGVVRSIRSLGDCFRPFAKGLDGNVKTQDIPHDYTGSVNLKDRTEDNLWTKSQIGCSANSCPQFAISLSTMYEESVTRENTFEDLDPLKSQALTPNNVTLRPDCSLTSPITRQKLLRVSENTEKHLKKTDLLSVKKNKTAGWECIQETHLYMYNAIQILENITTEIGYELAFPETNPNQHSLFMESRLEHHDTNHTNEALFESFKRLSDRVSHCCSQTILLVAIYLQEDINLCASAMLLPAALSFLKLYNRLIEAKKVLRERVDRRHFSSWTEETDKTRTDCVKQLMKASSSYVLRMLNRYILPVCKEKGDTGATSEDVSKLVSSISDAWMWLKELSKRSVTLCPSMQKKVQICLLETCMEAADKLSNTRLMLYIQDRLRGKMELTKAEKSKHETTVLSFLVPLYNNAKEIKSDLENCGLILVEEFPRISEASTKFGNLSNILKTAFQKADDSANDQSLLSAEIKPDCSTLAAKLVRNFFEILLIWISKGPNKVTTFKEILSGLCAQLDHLEYKLLLRVNSTQPRAFMVYVSPSVSSEASSTHDDVGSLVRNSGSNPSASNAEELAPRSSEEQASTVNKRSPFGHLHNRPPESETDSPRTRQTTTAIPASASAQKENYVHVFSTYDESIDRSLKSMPSGTYFFCASANDASKGPYCDEGSSGTIYKKYEGTTPIAVKESKCEDRAVASKRLQKEATIHQKLNSNRNIVRFLGTCTETDESGEIHTKGIKTEWCQFGDLRNAIQEAKWLELLEQEGNDISNMKDSVSYALYKNWIKRIEVIADVASGLAYMHRCNVVHRDLTCRNILLAPTDKNGEFAAKICDFERGFFLKDGEPIKRLSPLVNSVPWMGQEVLKKEKYGLKADVFSIGTLLWQLMYLGNPWTSLKEITGNDESFIKYQLTYGNLKLPISEEDGPENIPEFPRLVKLVKSAWQTNPDDRPSMAEFYATITSILESMKTRRFLENIIQTMLFVALFYRF